MKLEGMPVERRLPLGSSNYILSCETDPYKLHAVLYSEYFLQETLTVIGGRVPITSSSVS